MNPPESNPTFEAALGEVAWLRRLAVELVGPLWADDVVQDTLVAAWQRETETKDPRRWLARVARNLASKRRRGEARRGERQAEVALEKAGSDDSGIGARLRVQQELLRAIGELEASDRDLVVRRFLDDCTPAALAHELGLPAASVRSRLSRALAKLRTKLDGEFGQANWLGALVPWALPKALPPGLPHTLPPPNGSAAAVSRAAALKVGAASWFGAIGGLSVAKWMGAAIVAVVALGWWVLGQEFGALEHGTLPVQRAAERTAATPIAKSDAEVGAERVQVAAPTAQVGGMDAAPVAANEFLVETLRLTVVDGATQKPLEGVGYHRLKSSVIEAARGELTQLMGAPLATTDAAGFIRVEAPDGTPGIGYLVKAGYAELTVPLEPVFGDDVPDERDVQVEMWPDQRLWVRVVDAAGAALEDARVSIVTNAFQIEANKLGWGMSFGSSDAWDGRIRHASEAPTDEQGEAWVRSFGARVPLELEVVRDGALALVTTAVDSEVNARGEPIVLHLAAPRSLSGSVHTLAGAPLAGQELVLCFRGLGETQPATYLTFKTDAEGTFRVPHVPVDERGRPLNRVGPGPYGEALLIGKDELLTGVALDWTLAREGHLDVQLMTVASGRIAGHLVLPGGILAGPGLKASVQVQKGERFHSSVKSVNGVFEITGLEPGEYSLSCHFGMNAVGPSVLAFSGESNVQLQVPESAEVDLRIVANSSLPSGTMFGTSFEVCAFPDDGGTRAMFSIMSRPDTFAEVQTIQSKVLRPGRYRFVVRTLDGLIGFADGEVGLEPVEVTVPLQATGSLSFTFGADVEAEHRVRLLRDGREITWMEASNKSQFVPVGPLVVEWTRIDGSIGRLTTTVTAGAAQLLVLE